MTTKIKKITHPEAPALRQARQDEAIVTGRPFVERPFWYENTETGQCYYDIYGCIGWPTQIGEKKEDLPGYIAVVGIVKSNGKPEAAAFQLLAEAESKDVPTLLDECIRLRGEYGFGIHPFLMQAWLGDAERFTTTLALRNESLMAAGGDKSAILIIPPDDFYDTLVFDNYVRSLRSCLMPGKTRFYFGKNEILKTRLREFRKNDPAVMATGGLVHSMILRCTWLEQIMENMFTLED